LTSPLYLDEGPYELILAACSVRFNAAVSVVIGQLFRNQICDSRGLPSSEIDVSNGIQDSVDLCIVWHQWNDIAFIIPKGAVP
jgi:hypothetical protein